MQNIKETAAGGSIGAHSIAVRHDRMGAMQSRMSLKDFMLDFYSRINNRNKYGPLRADLKGSISKISESAAHPYQLDDATSRFKNMEAQGITDDNDTVSYAVQDDTDNLMIITVPLQQGEDLERRVAQALADVLDFKKTGNGENKTLAELLYELKDEFTVIDASFPVIPRDAVYNADEITEATPADEPGGEDGMDDMGGEPGMDDMGGEDGMDDMGGEPPMGDKPGEPAEPGMDDLDSEIGDDFGDGEDKESLLTSVLGMLKSQNEKETAQANAEIEKAKAKQAEIALKSSTGEMKAQEEKIVVQAEMDAAKDKEKRIKELADIAKFNYKKKHGLSEHFSPLFKSVIMEFDMALSPQQVARQKSMVARNYQTDPGAEDEEVVLNKGLAQLERKRKNIELQAAKKIEIAKASKRAREQSDKIKQGQDPRFNQNNPNNPQGGPNDIT